MEYWTSERNSSSSQEQLRPSSWKRMGRMYPSSACITSKWALQVLVKKLVPVFLLIILKIAQKCDKIIRKIGGVCMKNKEFIVTDMNVKEYTKKIAEWIKNQVKNAGADGVVLGMSGRSWL